MIDGREIVITKGPKREEAQRGRGRKTPSKDQGSVPSNSKIGGSRNEASPNKKSQSKLSGNNVEPRSPFKDEDEYIKTNMYDSEEEEEEYEIPISGSRQPERERSSSIKQRSKTFAEPAKKGYAKHPRRTAYKT